MITMNKERLTELAKQAAHLEREEWQWVNNKWRGPNNSLKREEIKQGLRIVQAIRLGYEEKEKEITQNE